MVDVLLEVAAADEARAARLDSAEPLPARVVVLPAAFNPPTHAHLELLRLAAEVSVALPAALLTTRNVDKELSGASLVDRVAMLHAASTDNGFAVLVSNQARFVDQASILTASFPQSHFDFALGYDTLVRLFDQRYYGQGEMATALAAFFQQHKVVVAGRGQSRTPEILRVINEWPQFAHRVRIVELPPHHTHASSSRAREVIEQGSEAEELPPAVADYIREHGLYAPRSTP